MFFREKPSGVAACAVEDDLRGDLGLLLDGIHDFQETSAGSLDGGIGRACEHGRELCERLKKRRGVTLRESGDGFRRTATILRFEIGDCLGVKSFALGEGGG